MKTKNMLLFIIVISLIFTGCWDKRELSNMIIVFGVAIDKADDNTINLSILVPIPQKGSSAENNSHVNKTALISESGEGIMDAYRKIEKKISREIFFSQLECIIIGEDLATSGVSEILDFFPRHREPPLKAFILFTKGEAADILKATSKLETNPADEIRKLESLNTGIKVSLIDYLYALTGTGIDPIAPLVEKVPGDKKNSNDPIETISLTGSVVFKNDKSIGSLNETESRGVLWLQDKVKTGVITIHIPKEKGGGKIAGRIIKSKTKIYPIINNDEIEMKVSIATEASVYENTSKLDLSDVEIIHYIEDLYAKDINNIIQLSLKKVQKELKTDVYGFGSIIYGDYPKLWESQYKSHWNEKFSTIKVNITCNVLVLETGYDSKSSTIKEEDLIK